MTATTALRRIHSTLWIECEPVEVVAWSISVFFVYQFLDTSFFPQDISMACFEGECFLGKQLDLNNNSIYTSQSIISMCDWNYSSWQLYTAWKHKLQYRFACLVDCSVKLEALIEVNQSEQWVPPLTRCKFNVASQAQVNVSNSL